MQYLALCENKQQVLLFFSRELMDNKVFFQHPDLMRALCVHETVMQLMVNTLNKAQQQQQSTTSGMPEGGQGRRSSITRRGSFNTGRRGSFTLQQVEQTKVCQTLDMF
jgi:ryanodine receptor 2